MAIYLIRHAHAGTRSQWDGDDEQRPLSNKGRRQAKHLARLLGDRTIGSVFSSPADRCIQTVEPLAEKLGRKVKIAHELDEGAALEPAMAFLLGHADAQPALCSHGDLVPQIIRRLHRIGMRTHDAGISQKASVWVIDVEDGSVTKGTYYPPE